MSAVVVVATFHPAPGRTDELIEAVTAAIPEVHDEDGCELYALHRDGDTVVMIEKWASREALGVHSRGAALTALGPKLRDLVSGPADVLVLDPVPAGTEARGTL